MPNSERPTKKLDLGGGYSITLKTFINQREFLKLVAQNKDEAAQETAALVATEMYVPGKDIITDPHLACVLQRTQLTGDAATAPWKSGAGLNVIVNRML